MFVDESLDCGCMRVKENYMRRKMRCTHKCLSHAYSTARRGGKIDNRCAFCLCELTNAVHRVVGILREDKCGLWCKGKGFSNKLECGASIGCEDDR